MGSRKKRAGRNRKGSSTNVAPSLNVTLPAGKGGSQFQQLKREVEAFGSTGLTRKNQYELQERRLQDLGATFPKGSRIPRNIGRGMAKKAREREDEQRSEARHLGMEQPRRNIPNDVKRGKRGGPIAWGSAVGDSFKGGVLQLRKQPKARGSSSNAKKRGRR